MVFFNKIDEIMSNLTIFETEKMICGELKQLLNHEKKTQTEGSLPTLKSL